MKDKQPSKDTYHWALELACTELVKHGRVYGLIEAYRSPVAGKPPTNYELLFADTLERLRAKRIERSPA